MDNNLINKTLYKFFNPNGHWHEMELWDKGLNQYACSGCEYEGIHEEELNTLNPDYFTDQVELLRELDKRNETGSSDYYRWRSSRNGLQLGLSFTIADIINGVFPERVYEWIKSLEEGTSEL